MCERMSDQRDSESADVTDVGAGMHNVGVRQWGSSVGTGVVRQGGCQVTV